MAITGKRISEFTQATSLPGNAIIPAMNPNLPTTSRNVGITWANISGNFVSTNQAGSFVTTGQTGNFVTTSQTGTFYSASNPSGYSSVQVTGSTAILKPNFTGIGGTIVSVSGNFITISGAAEGGSQTPWTSNINGGGYQLSNVSSIQNNNSTTIHPTSSAVTNGSALLAAYTLAKSLSPSSTSRFTIFLHPGNYDLNGQQLIIDTSYIDIIGLDSDEKAHIYSNVGTANQAVVNASSSSSTDYLLKNLKIRNTNTIYSPNNSNTGPAAFYPSQGANEKIINVVFVADDIHVWSHRRNVNFNGYYENCTAGKYSFGKSSGGIFVNCKGGGSSFGGGGTVNGTFTNCIGGDNSFGGTGGTVNGTFTDCTGGDYSFGGGGVISGIFTNCTGGEGSFGGIGGLVDGTFTDCTGGDYSFGGDSGNASGTFTDCTGGESSFGGGEFGNVSGTFTDCMEIGRAHV